MSGSASAGSIGRAAGLGAVAVIVAQLIAFSGFLVAVGVFGARDAKAASDPFIYATTGVLSFLWGCISALYSIPQIRLASVLAFIVTWGAVALVTLGASSWWVVNVAVAATAAVLGLLIAYLMRNRVPRKRA